MSIQSIKEPIKKVFFTSDHHFFHSNIIKYCKRPFSCVEEMNFELIRRHNEVVLPNDNVYFLGDFAIKAKTSDVLHILKQLNGVKHFIAGNHDDIMQNSKIKGEFHSFVQHPYKEIEIEKIPIILCHYAMRVWNKSHYGSYHLYGHSHGRLLDDPTSLSVDIGVDCFNYYPVEFEQIKKIMHEKQILISKRIEQK